MNANNDIAQKTSVVDIRTYANLRSDSVTNQLNFFNASDDQSRETINELQHQIGIFRVPVADLSTNQSHQALGSLSVLNPLSLFKEPEFKDPKYALVNITKVGHVPATPMIPYGPG